VRHPDSQASEKNVPDNLGAVGAAADDYMCYAFREDDKTWHPWGLKSEVNMLVCNGEQPAVESVIKKAPEVKVSPEL